MLAVGERQRDLLAVRGERRKDGEGQLDGLAAGCRTAERLALFRDCREQIADGAVVATVDELDVLDGFSLADTGCGDGGLDSVALENRQWFFVNL